MLHYRMNVQRDKWFFPNTRLNKAQIPKYNCDNNHMYQTAFRDNQDIAKINIDKESNTQTQSFDVLKSSSSEPNKTI